MKRQNLLLLFLLFYGAVSAQKSTYSAPDSLKNKDYDYLDDRFYELKRDSSRASVYAFTFLYKAKKEQNWKEIINGYQNLMLISPEKLRLTYTDSMIYVSKKSKDDALIGSAYLSKGTAYYGMKLHQQAMDNYLTANSYISKTKDQYLVHKVKYCIALTKFYIGFYDEAVSLLQECIEYYKERNPRPYLNTLHSLGLCYNKLGNYGKCTEINELGSVESKRLKIEEMIPYFNHSEGINEYFKKNYGASIKHIESSMETINKNNDFANEAIGYFYMGKSYWSLQQKEKAAQYFVKVDKIFNDKKYLRPDLRQSFELMISYYKTKKDIDKQLYYIDQLLKADTLLRETNQYIIGKIHKQYDTKELILEKERIAKENESITAELLWEKYYDLIFAGIILILFIVTVTITYRHYKTRKTYSKNYQMLMQELDTAKGSTKAKIKKAPLKNISPDTTAHLLKHLENFEKENRFLEKDWNLTSLSTAFKTNPKYLASVLDHSRDKGITEYINSLRIDYILYLLRKESKFRNYTYAALAEEAGFSTTERFTKAFLASTGISPTYFIEKLKKEKL
ncbi:helix-turn-helix domain-containing protein [Flavobacterium sp. ACN6]|uniref:helix-turn-helix domain-containing protein n=1 Tax=Flavobacterium sp. ACN6 TaxID=1920426 RepID=UPI000BB2F92C|nr:helix-turn-helix domain-containing protein [Flavobacterium sp. ACN6]PBJ08041.1 Helix-turn-helix domain protein [Flavobacterium sp. ACN6]